MQSVCLAASSVKDFRYSRLKLSAEENYLHMEISVNHKQEKYELQINPNNKKQLILTIFNARLKNDNLRKVKLDGEFADDIKFSEEGNNVKAYISLPTNAAETNYKAYMLDKNKYHRGSSILAVDISKKPAVKHQVSLAAIAGHTIVIDPGHGGSDSGAVGPDGIMEKTVTLAIAKKVDKILRDNGAIVVMTRTTDKDVYGPDATDVQELQARVNVAERTKETDIFLSIHANSFVSPSAHGTATYYYSSSVRGKKLAGFVQNELIAADGLTNRGISPANFYVLKHSSVPAILIETAFISNYKEEQLLTEDNFQMILAQAICRGINKYFQSN